MLKTKSNNKISLLNYLKSQNLMSLSTCYKKMWTALVYYVIDNKFNLYFLSEPKTVHCQHIIDNPNVSCSVADSKQQVTDKKIGVQIEGIASRVNNIERIKWMLALWNKLNPGFETIINLKSIQKKIIKSRIYQVKPKVIKFFNEELFGSEGYEIFEF